MQPSLRRKLPAMLALLALAACAEPTLQGGGDASLRAARDLWASHGIRDYGYLLTRTCDCPAEQQGPVRVEVRDGAPVSVTYAGSGEPAPQADFGQLDTVEELFDFIQRAIESKPFEIAQSYDVELGYPTRVQVNPSGARGGDQDGFAVQDFQHP